MGGGGNLCRNNKSGQQQFQASCLPLFLIFMLLPFDSWQTWGFIFSFPSWNDSKQAHFPNWWTVFSMVGFNFHKMIFFFFSQSFSWKPVCSWTTIRTRNVGPQVNWIFRSCRKNYEPGKQSALSPLLHFNFINVWLEIKPLLVCFIL